MKRIVELGDGRNVYARYNTNLSRINYRGINLYSDILAHIRDWQICASLDGTGLTGEYIRTGLNYEQWLVNFKEGLQFAKNRRQMRIDFTLTLPGLFEVFKIQKLADELGVDILAKVIFSFSPDIILSPLALPRSLLDKKIDCLVTEISDGALKDVLLQLKNRPTFEEQWPDTFTKKLADGKARVLQLETIRGGSTLAEILQQDAKIYEWYNKIS
jgi:hypothetical protein